MQDAGNQYPAWFFPVKNDMPALFHAAEAAAHLAVWTTETWIIGEKLATLFHL